MWTTDYGDFCHFVGPQSDDPSKYLPCDHDPGGKAANGAALALHAAAVPSASFACKVP